MKQFFKYTFASMLGFVLGSFALVLILVGVLTAVVAAGSRTEEVAVSPNSVLRITLSKELVDQGEKQDKFEGLISKKFGNSAKEGLNEVVQSIRAAAKDANIKGIYLDLTGMSGKGFASLQTIRKELVRFKQSKKFIYAYGKLYTQGAYFLASTADSIFLNPVGELAFNGLSSQTMFFGQALQRLEIDPVVVRVGTYKSAVEPFITDKMSEASKVQNLERINMLWDMYLTDLANARKIDKSKLNEIANGLLVRNAKTAVEYHMVDRLVYEDQIKQAIKRKAGQSGDDLETVSISDYSQTLKKETGGSNRIAVIYLQGDIVDWRAGSGQIGSADAIEEIEKAAANTRVKAIVLRVNSPGGSAFASEEIWHAAMEAKKKKPLVVSMGDYAASGGYYIATAADAIYAEPATITGSIGVFGIIPIANRFFKDKMGITFDGVKTDQFADLALPTKPMTEQEKAILQQGVNEFYATFLTRVANGRHMKENDVNEIAQGRVWVAVKAKEIGLVDRLGGLDDAIADAGKRAKLADYRIQEMPTPKGMFDKLLSEAEETVHLGAKVKEASQNPFQIIITQLNQMIGAKGVLATEYFRLSL